MATVVNLDRHGQLGLQDYRRIAFEHEAVAVSAERLAAVDVERQAMLRHLAGGDRAYGVNTGLGYLMSHSVHAEDQAAFQRSILLGRAAGIGPPLSAPVVRGTMLLRLVGFLSGRAGVSAELCRFIADRLNDGWLPVVPAAVSGAAGETVPLAHLFETFVGAGTVLVDGHVVGAADALADRGLAPFELGAKEGLALINGAPLAPALGVALALRAEALLEHATLAGTLAVAVIDASARPYSMRVGELKGDPGQLRVHRRIGELLEGGGRWGPSLQAPVSLRVIPQVHGTAFDVLEQLCTQLGRELRAVADSPLYMRAADAEPEGLYSTGGFHAQAVTLALEALAIATVHVLNLVEKRLHRLLDSRFSGLPEQLSRNPGRQSGLVILHKQVIGLAAEGATLASPASIRAMDASTGQEDFQAHTVLVARRLEQILDDLELALAYELVALRHAHDLSGRTPPAPLRDALDALAEAVPEITEDRSLANDVERVRGLIAAGTLMPEAPRSAPLLATETVPALA
ncbi:MAG: aromatic amino acid lyase [Solirubrobacteraceae bacterium]